MAQLWEKDILERLDLVKEKIKILTAVQERDFLNNERAKSVDSYNW